MEGINRRSERRGERSWDISSHSLPASVQAVRSSDPEKSLVVASPFQGCSSCSVTFLLSWAQALMPGTFSSRCVFCLRMRSLPVPVFLASRVDSPDPANASVGCPFIKNLSIWIEFNSVSSWDLSDTLYQNKILLHLQNQQIGYMLSCCGTVSWFNYLSYHRKSLWIKP